MRFFKAFSVCLCILTFCASESVDAGNWNKKQKGSSSRLTDEMRIASGLNLLGYDIGELASPDPTKMQKATTDFKEIKKIPEANSSELLAEIRASIAGIVNLPKHFFADQIQGKSCEYDLEKKGWITLPDHRQDFPKSADKGQKLNVALEYLRGIKDVEDQSKNLMGNSLTVDHSEITSRLGLLQLLTIDAVSRNDSEQADRIAELLVEFAETTPFVELIDWQRGLSRGDCWGGGDKNSGCSFHGTEIIALAVQTITISSVILKDHFGSENLKKINNYITEYHKKLVIPTSNKLARGDAFYSADFSLSLLGFGIFLEDKALLADELIDRSLHLARKVYDDGAISGASFRGNRGYWYHTLNHENVFAFAGVARTLGFDLLRSAGLRNKFQSLADATIGGSKDVAAFEKKYSYEKVDNASKDKSDARPHVHQMSIGLPFYIANEYQRPLTLQSGYLSRVSAYPFSPYVYFGGECFYESAGVNTPSNLVDEALAVIRDYKSEESDVLSLQFEAAFTTGSYSEKNYKDVKISVLNASVDGKPFTLQRLNFSLMFDLDPKEQAKPKYVRIQVEEDQLPEAPNQSSLDQCHGTTVKKDSSGLLKVRLWLGGNSEPVNNCLLASLGSQNRTMLLSLEKSLPEIIAASAISEFGQQAAELLKAYSGDYNELPEVDVKKSRKIRTENLKLNTSKSDACADPVFAKLMGQSCG